MTLLDEVFRCLGHITVEGVKSLSVVIYIEATKPLTFVWRPKIAQ
jgi:hypothetical protein